MNLTLPYPPALNRLYRVGGRRVYMTEEGQYYKQGVYLAGYGLVPLPGPVKLTIRLYRPARRGDIDGPLKLLLDSLEGIFYDDDKQIAELHVFRYDDKMHPRVEVDCETVR